MNNFRVIEIISMTLYSIRRMTNNYKPIPQIKAGFQRGN